MTMQPKTSKYRIRVEQVMPAQAEASLFAHPRCILGVSMTNPIFWRSSLATMLQWMAAHFEFPMVLVGDYLNRLNEQILNGGDTELAAKNALDAGNRFMEHLQQYLPATHPFDIVRWQPFHSDPDFWAAKAELEALYAQNASVQASIDSAATLFVWQKKDRASFKVDKATAIRLSAQYLLEEMAVFSVLIDRGWDVVVYPGAQLPLLMEIATGRFKDVPNSLHKGTYVELKVIKK